jgi:hypothetical protein
MRGHPPIKAQDDAGDRGTLLHAAIGRYINALADPQASVRRIDVDWASLAALVGVAPPTEIADMDRTLGRMIRVFHEHIEPLGKGWKAENSAETIFHKFVLKGHIDASAAAVDSEGWRVIVDWKTGWGEGDYSAQMAGYASVELSEYDWQSEDDDECQGVRAIVVHIATGAYQVYEFTRQDILDWQHWLRSLVESQGGIEYRFGAHCKYCPVRYTCEGRAKALASAIGDVGVSDILSTVLSSPFGRDLPESRDAMQQAWVGMAELARAIEEFKDRVRDSARDFGPIPLSDGTEIAIDQSPRRLIGDTKTAWSIVEAEIGREALMAIATIPKTKLEDAVKAAAPRGQKAQRLSYVLETLEAKGAMTLTQVETLRVRKPIKQEETPSDE